MPGGGVRAVSAGKDLKGRRFGRLTVIERAAGSDSSGCRLWLCRCDCGNGKIVSSKNLLRGHTRSCGCIAAKDLTGKRFGRLTVLHITDRRTSYGGILWLCRCDCGKHIEAGEGGLVHGSTVSCGCRQREAQEALGNARICVDGTCLQSLNHHKARSDSRSGIAGVRRNKRGKYEARINLQGRMYWLGTYRSLREAEAAREKGREELHQGFIDAYCRWEQQAAQDAVWAAANPFSARVRRENGHFLIQTTVYVVPESH